MIKMNKFIFLFPCFFVGVCHAATFITFDTVALDTAMNEITRVGSDSPYKTAEEAGDALYDAFYSAKKNNTVDIDKVADKCVNEIIKSGRICNNFITAYNTHLDKANYCLKANNFETGRTRVPGTHETSFQECYKYNPKYYNSANDEVILRENGKYSGDSIYGQCIQWIEAAEQCQTYLIGYYQEKLDNSKLSKTDKKYYECLLDKVKTGNIDFPLSKMEESCK